jgi:signal transduction histidine kinase/ActR/RegA family two-component response regulator
MPERLLSKLLPQSFYQGSTLARRRGILSTLLVLVGGCSLPFYFIPQPDYDHRANLVGSAVYWILLALLRLGVAFEVVAHATLLWSIVFVFYLAAYTGGINSPVMVWSTVSILPAILLLERKHALIWVGALLLSNVALFYISQQGWVDININMSNDVMGWTLANKFFVVSLSIIVVYVSERMHRTQVAEVDQSNQDLVKTHQALISAQAHKDEFIASVGHELRTPMNAILGLNGILRNELVAKKEDVEIVDLIRKSTEQLLQVVNDILDFSQLQAGRLVLHKEDFALRETVAAVMAHYAHLAKSKNIELRLDATSLQDVWVHGDRQRLVQVLKNLLDNAYKFTAAGSVIVKINLVKGGVLFNVQDTGIGIAADRQQQIFNGFEHADIQTNRQYGGTGLGLSICERLISLQGGTIGVISQLGHGARFWFQLPLPIVPAHQAIDASAIAGALKERQFDILLVDDNAVNLLVARLMLQKCFPKAQITEADGGARALELLAHQNFELVLMDMVMPEIDGIQATQTIRHNFPAPTCDIPILALTASSNPVDNDRCIAAGMNDVVQKPLEEKSLVGKIASVMTQMHGAAS